MANEIISRISKGTKMDQVYLPKTRIGLEPGEYVVITPLNKKLEQLSYEKPFLYNIKEIEPIKLQIINEIFSIIEKHSKDYENIIITGSFLEKGFNFNDIDILLITNNKIPEKEIKSIILNKLGMKGDLLILNNKFLVQGLNSDPLYQMMLSNYISKKRLIYNIKKNIDYKILDLHLLKNKSLIDSFEILNGREKYYLIRNLISIKLFIENKKLSNDIVNKEIEKEFNLSINEIKQNLIDKNKLLPKYKKIYNIIFNKIMDNIKNAPK